MKPPIVTISTGKLQGKISTNFTNTDYYSFQGIPYAKPPIGNLRFKAPVPADSWPDIREATKEGDDCMQYNTFFQKYQGSEDCLTLNVYTPNIRQNNEANKNLPVMVWIHGGAFTSGSGSTQLYGPEFLLTKEIVLVSINYRVGILGFLSLENPKLDVPGNAGLKDIVLALKWVQNNISVFHGNPKNVTIFGESAGAAAAHYLMLSPKAKGLFQKAILQSGCALNIWGKGQNISKSLALLLNVQSQDEKQLLQLLTALPAQQLLETSRTIPDQFLASNIRPIGPVVEKPSSSAFLTEHPLDIIKSGKYSHVPIIIGYNSREGMLTEFFKNPTPFRPDFEVAIPNFISLQRGSEISQLIAKEIKQFYYGEKEPSPNCKDEFYKLESDNFFVREIVASVNLHLQRTSQPIYLYKMTVESSLNLLKTMAGITEPGVCHGDDLGYLFKNLLTPDIEKGSLEDISIKRFVSMWTNFAKFGSPNGKTIDSIVNVKWEPVSQGNIRYLDIGESLVMRFNPDETRMKFWKDLFSKIKPKHKL